MPVNIEIKKTKMGKMIAYILDESGRPIAQKVVNSAEDALRAAREYEQKNPELFKNGSAK